MLAMRQWSALALATLLFGVCLVHPSRCQEEHEVEDDEYADEDRAFIVARKYIQDKDVVLGYNTTVIIELYNGGTSSALNVEVQDAAWPAALFEVVGGGLTAFFDKIPAGATVQHIYHVKPKAAGSFDTDPAHVTYRPESDAPTTQKTTSAVTTFAVISPVTKTARHVLKAGSFLTLGIVRTPEQWRNLGLFGSVIGALLGGNWLYKYFTRARKERQYRSAYEAVQKMK